ncbi:hypothetical protein ACFPRL_30400 [Pseudoclavibacter helvolus]
MRWKLTGDVFAPESSRTTTRSSGHSLSGNLLSNSARGNSSRPVLASQSSRSGGVILATARPRDSLREGPRLRLDDHGRLVV